MLRPRIDRDWERRARSAVGFVTLAATAMIIDGLVIPSLYGHPYNAHRPDYYYMADAFLHGHLWLKVPWQPPMNDLVIRQGHVYVPFQPGPAFLLLPLVAAIGTTRTITLEPLVNGTLTGLDVGLVWVLVGRLGVGRPAPRLLLTVLFGFGTVLWNITLRGGVWHTAEIVATGCTLWALVECQRESPRAVAIGLLGGFAFLSRAVLVLALPYYAWVVVGRPSSLRQVRDSLEAHRRSVARLAVTFVPFLLFTLWYDWARFGSAWETGYSLATLPPFLRAARDQGLFSLVHVPMNLRLTFFQPPIWVGPPALFRPDPLGMSYSSGARRYWSGCER